MSADPALANYLGNRADKLPGQGGVFNPVNLALYCYAGNNPIKYTDPNGMSIVDDAKKIIGKVWSFITGGNKGKATSNNSATSDNNSTPEAVRYFKQSEFDNRYKEQDKTFNKGFGKDNADYTELNTACHVTANINEISEEYTKVTGKAMTKEMAEAMMDKALANGSMDVWGRTGNGAEFFNDAWSVTGLPGIWEVNEKGDHTVYRTDRYNGPHYENSGPNGGYFDTWSGKEMPLPEGVNDPPANRIFHYRRKE